MKNIAITIDGPAAAGKTTAAKALAAALPGFRYVDTGAFYRMIACYRKTHDGPDWLDGAEAAMKAVPGEGSSQDMLLLTDRGWYKIPDITLRSPETSEQASILSTDPRVRNLANTLIRAYAAGLDVVMEGRDTGTVILPDADGKFYLDASVDVRAVRRNKDLAAAGTQEPLETTRANLAERDKRDSTREHDPLRIPNGATVINNSDLDAAATFAVLRSAVLPILGKARRTNS